MDGPDAQGGLAAELLGVPVERPALDQLEVESKDRAASATAARTVAAQSTATSSSPPPDVAYSKPAMARTRPVQRVEAAVEGGVVGQARQQALQQRSLHDQHAGQDHASMLGRAITARTT